MWLIVDLQLEHVRDNNCSKHFVSSVHTYFEAPMCQEQPKRGRSIACSTAVPGGKGVRHLRQHTQLVQRVLPSVNKKKSLRAEISAEESKQTEMVRTKRVFSPCPSCLLFLPSQHLLSLALLVLTPPPPSLPPSFCFSCLTSGRVSHNRPSSTPPLAPRTARAFVLIASSKSPAFSPHHSSLASNFAYTRYKYQ